MDLTVHTVSFKLAATTYTDMDSKDLGAQKRYLKLNNRKRRRKIQFRIPDQHDSYMPVWLKKERKYYIDPTFPQGCGHQSLDTYDLPKSYLQGDHRNYNGFTWINEEFGPRKRKWGTKRYTKNWFCANVFGCECKHTEKHLLMKEIMDENNRFNN